ncbi:NAD-dependent epimerase/dehydratase family protein [Dokdonia sinensis]|uniref:NAD-dependent epimerase/dehydratase family protein n=1 Tax=Dokdonia sinensis TaxID=2479847 RepID=A0A3M0FYP6_9FLAO|nr:NAD-dependent epimerase/dehydratase family protein [Dokdonia sinensis]RMB57608.1 NAD-dependent epimerase/dehydratase family protein [Dokdonia sinensis]
MKILITGAAGFIGSHLSEKLQELGHQVFGIDNFSSYYDVNLKRINAQDITNKGVRLIEGDLLDNLSQILPEKIDVLYHFAAQPGISADTPLEDYERNNIEATKNLIKWVTDCQPDLKLFVNISTSSVYGLHATSTEVEVPRPASHYGETKLAAETLVLSAQAHKKFPATSIRLFSVYGPRERPEKLYTKLIKAIYENQPFPLYEGSLEHERSFTYVGDIVNGLTAILSKISACNGEIINLGSSEVYTTSQGISLIEKIIGKKANLEMRSKRSGDQLKTSANIEKAKRILDYAPQMPFEQGLRAQVAWYNEKFIK